MKRIITAVISVVLCFALSGCSKHTDDAQDVQPVPDFAPLNEIAEGRSNIYLIVKCVENNSYWQVVKEGARDGGDAFGCNVYCSGSYVETDWQSQEKLMGDAIAAGADAIMVAPNDSVSLSGKIDEIYQNGTPIVLIDTTANTDNYDICYMTDNLMAGQNAAEEMLYLLRKNGNADTDTLQVGIQIGAASSQTIIERLSGFVQYWSKYAPASWEIIPDIKSNGGDLDKGLECTRELLEYPEIKGVFGTNNGSTIGLVRGITEQERTDVAVVGFDYSEEIAALIEGEAYAASTVLQQQYHMGYTGVESALKLIAGETMPVKFVDTGVIVVNKDTLYQEDVQEVLLHN